MKTQNCFLTILFVLTNSLIFAQNNFPSWMDEVKFEKKSTFFEFEGPKDPETGKVTTLEPKRGKSFKPRLPDFAEMRKKSTKTQTETGSDTIIIQENKSTSSSVQSLKDIPELATATDIIEVVNRLASETVSSITNNITEDEEPSEEELRRRRIYKPGQIKSFYIESKEAEKKKK